MTEFWYSEGIHIKTTIVYIFAAAFNLIGGICFLFAGILEQQSTAKYAFFFAAICLCVSGIGFLFTYFKNKPKK